MDYERTGKGKRVFLGIHGWAGNHRTFRPLLTNLPEDVSFYAVDLPGYGTGDNPEQWDMAEVAKRLSETIQEISENPVTIVGYCGGSNLGVMAAALVPGKVERLVFIDPFAYMPWYFRIFTWGEFGRRAYFSTFASARGRKLTNSALKSKRTGDTDLTRSFEAVDHELMLRVLRGFSSFPSYATFATVKTEVDLAYGERSFKAVKRGVQMWKKIWPHARVHELPGAGHSPIH
ncbi:MAG TPA: alpha/beta hydrolase, partial [Candidatus Hydrogenedentes bacterium]|nr:alpha/beta hydrolase [Candidatus Hydrogenedentota bacterium]